MQLYQIHGRGVLNPDYTWVGTGFYLKEKAQRYADQMNADPEGRKYQHLWIEPAGDEDMDEDAVKSVADVLNMLEKKLAGKAA